MSITFVVCAFGETNVLHFSSLRENPLSPQLTWNLWVLILTQAWGAGEASSPVDSTHHSKIHS